MADPAIDAKLHLPWKRYWCPREGTMPLVDGGFLLAPDSENAKWFGGDVVPFERVASHSCLILLGEPGMGKSTALESEITAIGKRAAGAGESVHMLNLRAYGDEDRLVRAIFDHPKFNHWAGGSHVLHLVLDSLDECLLRVNTVADVLLEGLNEHRDHVHRLVLRIACRTAEWPSYLENGLVNLWGTHGIGVYELAPLTRQDVQLAAHAYGVVDAEQFLAEVHRVSAVPLVIKPVTLHFLLKTFRRDGRLPATQNQLYEEGCRLLCEETSSSRRAAGALGELTADQRLSLASRIAAVTTFCNRSSVYTAPGSAADPVAELEIRDLAGGTEPVRGDQVDASEAALREALASGLFSSRGPDRLGWAHQTYREFLAARYLVMHQMPLTQMLDLLLHPVERDKVVPQLHETAAWLAGMSSAAFETIMQGDPQVLLRSDVVSATDETRAKLVEAMLRRFAAGQLVDTDMDLRRRYRKLNHVELHRQLEPYIRDGSIDFVARRFAIDLAEDCEIRSLQSILADVALDGAEQQHIRAQAAHAVVALGDDGTRSRLRPLAEGRGGTDPDDELKGCGLRALWPKLIGVEELVLLLTPQKRPNLYGAYAGFLSRDLPEGLRPEDLPVALEWASRQPPRYDPFNYLGKLADEIVRKSWERLEDPETLEAFTEVALARSKEHIAIVRRDLDSSDDPLWSRDDRKRRILIDALIPRLNASGVEPASLIYGQSRLITIGDLSWLVDRLRASTSQDTRRVWATLVRNILLSHQLSSEHLDLNSRPRLSNA